MGEHKKVQELHLALSSETPLYFSSAGQARAEHSVMHTYSVYTAYAVKRKLENLQLSMLQEEARCPHPCQEEE